ncbi:hypothetical protein CY35_09G000500 [Sphagnum magellanicum]|nr:hypothetical protein CY35_09G000500 [Sphagnum magellanicum]
MANTSGVPASSVPYGAPGKAGTGYPEISTGAPAFPVAPPAERPRVRRAHRALNCLNFLLRVLTAFASAAAFIAMLFAMETVVNPNGQGQKTVEWHSFIGFRWFLLANTIICAYSILAAIAACISVCIGRGPLSYTPLAWLTFLVDFVLANALMSAAAAATTVVYIAYRGENAASWAPACNRAGRFCRRAVGAVIASYVAWLLLALSTILAVSAIHQIYRTRRSTATNF